jgi:uroporphyrinogen III methyltransferase/synthase
VVVTRPRRRADALSSRLRELGAAVVEYPTIAIEPPEDLGPLRRAVRALPEYDWVVFTSVNGVDRVLSALEGAAGEPSDALAGSRVAAIGPATADALRAAGVRVDVVPDEYRAEALLRALRGATECLEGRRVLLARAAEAREVLPEGLRRSGARVDEVAAYRTVPGRPDVEDLPAGLRRGEVDWLTFTASSTVRNFVDLAGRDVGPARVATIGPITAGTAQELGLPVHAVAEEYTVPGLVRALVDAERATEEVGGR